MSQDAFDVRATTADCVFVPMYLIGAGAAAPTKTFGNGLAVTYVSTGKYRITMGEHLGTFSGGWGHVLHSSPTATTPMWLQIEHDTYSSSARTVDFYTTTPATDTVAAALADLSSSTKALIVLCFRRTVV